MSIQRNKNRIAQTQGEFERLRAHLDDWLKNRTASDKQQQYATQLKVLRETLSSSLQKLKEHVVGISPTGTPGDVYRSCQAYEQYLLWVQRVWEYYRSRFDQRDHPELKDVLAAADEVVWSCFHAIFPDPPPGTAVDALLRPAPLPYIEPFYSPQALDRPPRELLSADISPEFQKKLEGYLKQLPIPLVGLPAWCVRSPWWLVYLGHEVGHHVQREAGAEEPFAAQLMQALIVDPEPGDPHPIPALDEEAAGRWAGWGNEVFADVFSLLMLGPPAYYAMFELETGNEVHMLTERRPRYPSPVLRLILMQRLLAALGSDPINPLYPEDLASYATRQTDTPQAPALQAVVAADLSILPRVVSDFPGYPAGSLGSLTSVCGWDPTCYQPGGIIDNWAALLRGPLPPEPEPSLSAARQIIGGAVLAWTQIAGLDDDRERTAEMERLREYLLPVLKNSREPGTRAGAPESRLVLPEEDLADLLLQTDPIELGEG